MFARAAFRSHCAGATVAILLLASTAVAGEQAKITPPASAKAPASLAPAKSNELPFRPLDGASSVGGVVDPGSDLPAVAPAAPDARTQKEMFERLDRKRNFLLDDSSSEHVGGQPSPGAENDENTAMLKSSRKPETLLERRLRNGGRTSQVETSARLSENDGSVPSVENRNSLYRERDPSPLFLDTGSDLGKRFNFGGAISSSPARAADESSSTTLLDLRSALSDAGGRGVGLDALSRERFERYQQSSGDGGRLRLGLADQAAVGGRTRESRLDTMDGLLAAPTPTGAVSELISPAPADAEYGLSRRGAGFGSSVQGTPSVYPPPVPAAATPSSPAARLLKEPRPEPPRFPL